MKDSIVLLVLIFTLISCGKKNADNEQKSFQSYGAVFDPNHSLDISNITPLMENSDSVAITLTGKIEKTCAVKGCWMQLKTNNNKSIRVTFKDYGFFVPKSGMEGKLATIKGYCLKQETSVEELKHYAEDAGESEDTINLITAPKMEYSFVASGVIIQN